MDEEIPAVVGLATLQWAFRDCFNTGTEGCICLVRETGRGTPGPTLCGRDRFAKDAPGWSVRGGLTGPASQSEPCDGCWTVAARDFAGLPVHGIFAALFATVDVEG
jgi:hypothetical protein